MSDAPYKAVGGVGISAIKAWVKNLFATKTELSTLSNRVDAVVSEGGEPNVIESVKVNGTALTVTDKAVDVTVPTTVASLSDASDYATKDYVGTNGGKIDTISVNGTAQTITNKNVDITVPTTVASLTDAANYALASSVPSAVSDLTNDSGYQTASDVQSAINTAVASAYTVKEPVATVDALPSSGNKTGDVRNVTATDMNYVWDGSKWDAMAPTIDMSGYVLSSDIELYTYNEVMAILEAE